MLPVKEFMVNANRVNRDNWEMEDGMLPVNSLSPNDNTVRRVISGMKDGMVPLNLFASNVNQLSRVNWENEDGIFPVNWLLLNDNLFNWVNLDMDDGILPWSAFPLSFKAVNCVKTPISLGIVDPFVESPPSKLSNASVVRQSVKDWRPMKSQAICSGVKARVGTAVGFNVTGGDVGVGVVVPPEAFVRYITSTTVPTTTRRARKQLPTSTARLLGR